jgi:hypothetical protein
MSDNKIMLELRYDQVKSIWNILKERVENGGRAVEAFNNAAKNSAFSFQSLEGQTLHGLMNEMLLEPAELGMMMELLGILAEAADKGFFNQSSDNATTIGE